MALAYRRKVLERRVISGMTSIVIISQTIPEQSVYSHTIRNADFIVALRIAMEIRVLI